MNKFELAPDTEKQSPENAYDELEQKQRELVKEIKILKKVKK